jgi:hypothetical protein
MTAFDPTRIETATPTTTRRSLDDTAPKSPLPDEGDGEVGGESGFRGEYFVPPAFNIADSGVSIVGVQITQFWQLNWTSFNRAFAGFSPVGEGLSDFMYYDQHGHLAMFLNMKGRGKMFYLEVKSTTTESRSFHMSPNQIAFVFPLSCHD